MVAKINSGAIVGVEGYIVEVEADISQGMPMFDIVGLPDSAVKESRERVRTALKNSGFVFPVKHITINLAPADIRKEGPYFDLPIAIGVLTCMGVISPICTKDVFVIGELSLDGSIRPVNGILPMVYGAYRNGLHSCVVPLDNAEEAALVSEVSVVAPANLKELIAHFTGQAPIQPFAVHSDHYFSHQQTNSLLDFKDVKGQESVKRALEIAAAGTHNVIMIGPPGSGKTMMAKRLPTILSDLSFGESIEITKIYSVSGLLANKGALVSQRPFRSPHHTISDTALTGGGRIPKPGEISLAHNGVLFLDELPEFHKNVLEVMRQPLEDGEVTISRVNGTITYPSNFMLIASMNPCPCGYYPDSKKCSCSQPEIAKYLGRISGPLLDRIDIQVEAPKVDYQDLGSSRQPEDSATIKLRVLKAQQIQTKRYKNEAILFNSQLTPSGISEHCVLTKDGQDIIQMAFDRLGLSARAYHKILKVARTIADLETSEQIMAHHLAEAIQYRSLDRKYWN